MKSKPGRPAGVVILSVLSIVFGVGYVVFGVIGILSPFGVAAVEIGLFYFLLGLLSLSVGTGYWVGRPWGWSLGVAGGVITVVINAVDVGLRPTGLVTDGPVVIFELLVIYYLTRPRIRAFFGRAPAPYTTA